MKRTTALLLLLLALVLTGTAGAQIPDDERPPLVTDYATYPGTPQAFLTPGCDFAGVLEPTFGARLVATGAAEEFGPVGSLGELPTLGEGDLVRMAWTGVAPECIGSAVSFVVKVALGPSFDPTVDQLTGPNGGYSVEFLVAGPGEITFPMPDLARFGLGCDYQLDAIVGIPLRDIGPSGSFFSQALRLSQGKATADDRTTVISAKNGTYANCEVPPTTTVPITTTAPTTTVLATTTVAPTTTLAVTPPVQTVTVSQGPIPTVRPSLTAQRELATTGPDYMIGVGLIGLAVLIAGAFALLASRRRAG